MDKQLSAVQQRQFALIVTKKGHFRKLCCRRTTNELLAVRGRSVIGWCSSSVSSALALSAPAQALQPHTKRCRRPAVVQRWSGSARGDQGSCRHRDRLQSAEEQQGTPAAARAAPAGELRQPIVQVLVGGDTKRQQICLCFL